VAPSYPRAAEAAGIESRVPLEIVVDARGNVTSARCLSHVGYGLDEAALRGIRDYRFSPARRHGRAVPVRMRWVVQFELR
jgi:TonB family protein